MKYMKLPLYSLLLCLTFVGCATAQQIQDPIPAHDTFTIDSKEVGETRTINVWTPPGYTGKDGLLPVMYMADGGINEDFPHMANTFDKLIATKSIPPMILVGIENTQRRRDLTGPTTVEKDKEIAPVVGGSEKFRAFIREELIPEINRRYRTSDRKGILGESLSGLFVVETFLLTPELFDYYIAFDPSLWWNDHYLVRTAKEQMAKFPATQIRLWFASSNVKDIRFQTRELAKILKEENNPFIRWTYADARSESHATIFRATKEEALRWTLGAIE
jgi:predicted alpha/beta superfamily hydrolase